jgi:hypothetical protein
MLINLTLGTIVIAATAVVHTLGLIGIARFESWLQRRRSTVFAMAMTVIGVFFLLTVEVWIWALVYFALDVVGDFDTALYFSLSSFSTLGFGDVVPTRDWRILAALEGVNGFLLIGWSTAHLIAASIRVGPFRTGEHF